MFGQWYFQYDTWELTISSRNSKIAAEIMFEWLPKLEYQLSYLCTSARPDLLICSWFIFKIYVLAKIPTRHSACQHSKALLFPLIVWNKKKLHIAFSALSFFYFSKHPNNINMQIVLEMKKLLKLLFVKLTQLKRTFAKSNAHCSLR